MKTILAVLVGFVVGSIVNMGLVTINGAVIPLPEGFDNSSMEALAETIHLLEPQNYLLIWLGHALGTLVGALVAVRISGKPHLAWFLGGFFLIGGVMMVLQVDSPTWFDAIDLIGAYLPMAWLATKLSGGASVGPQA